MVLYTFFRAFLKGGDLNPGERHSRDTLDDGTVTLCTLRAATVLSRDCRADFGRPLTKKVMSHSRDGPGVTAPLRTNIVPLTRVWNTTLPLPPLKKSLTLLPCSQARNQRKQERRNNKEDEGQSWQVLVFLGGNFFLHKQLDLFYVRLSFFAYSPSRCRGPKNPPKIPKYQKKHRVYANFFEQSARTFSKTL